MLRSEHSIVAYKAGHALPDRLTRSRHTRYLEHARKMLAVYRSGIGRTRRELHRSIENVLSAQEDCERRRIAAFCKLLDDRSEFEKDARGAAAELRLRVFSLAAAYHPLVGLAQHTSEKTIGEVRTIVSAALKRPWPHIETALYADIIELQPLKAFHGYDDAEALLSRYNVAQVQACLYPAEKVAVIAGSDFKTILRYAKLARLLHEIRRTGGSGYEIQLTGPASVLQQTRRYGANFARFVPALLACRQWELRADICLPWGNRARLALTSDDGLTSHLPSPQEFDSSVEERFAKEFGEKKEGWRCLREAAILHDGQATFVPDFVFRHDDGREALLEIVGFWTPEYLVKKRQTLHRFSGHRVLLAVAERSLRVPSPSPRVIVYKKSLDPAAVVKALVTANPA
jgi:predicted nuclease of restriction endonuclease-like RecB superfamily